MSQLIRLDKQTAKIFESKRLNLIKKLGVKISQPTFSKKYLLPKIKGDIFNE